MLGIILNLLGDCCASNLSIVVEVVNRKRYGVREASSDEDLNGLIQNVVCVTDLLYQTSICV